MSGLSNPMGWLVDWFRRDTGKGKVPVTNDSMLSIPEVFFCIQSISGDVGQMPLAPHKVYEQARDGRAARGSTADLNHTTWRLLRDEPNKVQTSDVFKELLQSHALGWGNGRAAIIRNGAGAVTELLPMMPDRTGTVMVMGVKYHVTCPTEDDPVRFRTIAQEIIEGKTIPRDWIVLNDEDVLHIMGYSRNGFIGLNLADLAKDSMGTALGGQRYSRTGMDKGFAGRLMLTAPPNAFKTEDDAKKFLTNFRERHENSKDGETVGLLREGITADVLQMSNVDAQMIEQRRFSRQDAMLWFALQHLPGDDSSVSYNSLEQKLLAHRASALNRWLTRWEMQCDAKLRTEAEKAGGQLFYKFNRATTLATDTATSAEVLSKLRMAKIITQNEARDKLDMNPVEGGDEFENPATSTAAPVPPPEEPDDSEAMAKIQSMVALEAKQVANGAKRPGNFLNWLDKHYAKWSTKLEQVAVEFGADVETVSDDCESRRLAVVEACDCKDNELVESVGKVCETWKSIEWGV